MTNQEERVLPDEAGRIWLMQAEVDPTLDADRERFVSLDDWLERMRLPSVPADHPTQDSA